VRNPIPPRAQQAIGKPQRVKPELVEESGRVRLEMRRDHPKLVQHVRALVQAWRMNVDVQLLVDQCVLKLVKYICGYMCTRPRYFRVCTLFSF
jgi:predicted type IV restriction endonuclease